MAMARYRHGVELLAAVAPFLLYQIMVGRS